jgi:very-short-patch-repair endonuclease
VDGLVTRKQLLAAGISSTQIWRRLKNRILLPAYPGVYWVGHREQNAQAWYRAAVLACGDGAVLSGKAAAHLWGILKGSPPQPHVMTTRDLRIKGIRTRRSRRIDSRDVTAFRGIPITTVACTIVDLAGELTEDGLALACHEAGVKYRTTPAQVDAVLARKPNAKGAAKLRLVMHGDVRVALSKLERGFLRLLRAEHLPLPITNKIVGERRVDCRWPEQHVTVELDSYQFHNSRHSWQQGYEREREAYAREDAFRRYTWRDVFEDPQRMLAELRTLLVHPSEPGATRAARCSAS